MTWHCFEGYTLKAKRWHLATFGFPFITKIDYIYSLKPVAQVGVDVEPCCRCDRPGRECEELRTDEGRTRSIIKCTVSKNVLLHNNICIIVQEFGFLLNYMKYFQKQKCLSKDLNHNFCDIVHFKVSESGLFDVFSTRTYVYILISVILTCLIFIVMVYKV